MSRIGKLPIAVPSGVDVAIDERLVTVKGPKGTLSHSVAAADHRREERRRARGQASRRRAREPLAARPDPHPDQQHGRRRHRGLREEARDRRRGLPRPVRRARPSWSSSSGTPTRSRSTPPRASRSLSRAPPSSASRASTSSWSARSPPTSASCASPSPTRARASATPASTSAARSERLVSDHGDHAFAQQAHRCAHEVAPASSGSWPQEDLRHRRAPAPRRHPFVEAHHGAGRRRPGRQDARVRLDHGGGPARPSTATRRPRRRRSASSSPSAPRRPASTAWSSTAPATSTTVASRPWPMAPARAA